jgi:hypothetical protein
MGILVVNLPTIDQCCSAYGDVEKALVSSGGLWTSFSTRNEYEHGYPYMPIRILN